MIGVKTSRDQLELRVSLWPELAREINCHVLVNEYGDLSFFSHFLN